MPSAVALESEKVELEDVIEAAKKTQNAEVKLLPAALPTDNELARAHLYALIGDVTLKPRDGVLAEA
jgi:hypothetical protein